jgi:hypothetical protein
MGLKEKRRFTSVMLNDLGKQHEIDEFNEFSQFSEDTLRDLVLKLNESQLNYEAKMP